MKFTTLLKLTLFLIGIVIIGNCIFTKAAYTSFTHDESFSYLTYVHTSFMDIISFKNFYTNNHILNSLLMKYSERVFGTSELTLRLPNVIAFFLFSGYLVLLMWKRNFWISIGFFFLLLTYLPLVDFFGLARGYGLSIGFMLMGIYHLNRVVDERKGLHVLLFHFAAMLGTLSNFTLFSFYLSGIFLHNLLMFFETKIFSATSFHFFRVNKWHLIGFVINSIVLYEPLRRLLQYNSLDFGQTGGFWEETIGSLASGFNDNMPCYLTSFFQIALLLAHLIPLALWLYKVVRKDVLFYTKYKTMIVVNGLLTLITTISIISHYIKGSNYFVARFALFLMPFYVLNAYLLIEYLADEFAPKVLMGLSFVILITTSLNFYSQFTLEKIAEWTYDKDTKRVMQLMADDRSKFFPGKKIRMAVFWLFEPTCNFYRKINHMDWLEPVERKTEHKCGYDYYYLKQQSLDSLGCKEKYEVIHDLGWEDIKFYRTTW